MNSMLISKTIAQSLHSFLNYSNHFFLSYNVFLMIFNVFLLLSLPWKFQHNYLDCGSILKISTLAVLVKVVLLSQWVYNYQRQPYLSFSQFLCHWHFQCNIPVGMLWDGSGCHHVCAYECVRWMLLYLFHLLTQGLLWLLAGYCCAQMTQFYTPM